MVTASAGYVVQAGPFTGMMLPARTAWGDGDTLPKLLGCYEAELHDTIARLVNASPDIVVNIGAAEGYYAIGLARLLPRTRIAAFDSSMLAQDICQEAARLNGVDGRVTVAGICTPGALNDLLATARAPWIVCDCEGAELDLIDPARAPALSRCHLIVECHDFINPAITQTLVQRLQMTHAMLLVQEGARDPNASPLLRGLNSLDRWLAVCEFRPTTMHWLVAHPRSEQPR